MLWLKRESRRKRVHRAWLQFKRTATSISGTLCKRALTKTQKRFEGKSNLSWRCSESTTFPDRETCIKISLATASSTICNGRWVPTKSSSYTLSPDLKAILAR